MRVAFVSGPRSAVPMGMELAELRLIESLRARANGTRIEARIVGGCAARSTARRLGGRWVPARPGRAAARAWHGADLVHLAGLELPPPPPGVPFVLTVHDLAPLRFGDEGTLPSWSADSLRRAATVICPSRFTADELAAAGVGEERLRVVSSGPGHDLSRETAPLAEAELGALGLRRPFVLRAGGWTERKNVGLLLDVWPDVRRRSALELALAGPAHPLRAERLAAAPSLDGVVALDYVRPEAMPRLLRAATALVTTSTYEGFGLPPLEAMAAGVPVVAVDAPFVREVCGDAALVVEPEKLADALVRIAGDDGLRHRLADAGVARAAQFSWERTADLVLDVYRSVGRARTST